ncbi:expressed unknown protein [Seminavis robusta]|uniref:Uncharacterized protein n=1 Tax=Seminavis robusta TaxID=568900 RepID=A0A9N8HJP8_9STRA|nr:expressed unknown protein [Seminavis robusta]|eukprot:Sro780_g201460.1 n/a (130) ;mRNA; f:18196-18585
MTASANRSPRPHNNTATVSPTVAPRRLVEATMQLGSKLPSWLLRPEEESSPVIRRRSTLLDTTATKQRDLVQIILEDPEQWEKLHQAMQEQKSCTSMGLTQNLRSLIQDRIEDMQRNDGIANRQRSFTD